MEDKKEIDETVIKEKPAHKTIEERVEESGHPLEFSPEVEWGEPEGSEVY